MILTLSGRRNLWGWIFILPWIFGFLFLLVFPLLQSIRFSFSELNVIGGGYTTNFVGAKNYYYLFKEHPDFIRIVTEAIGRMCYDVPLIVIFSVFSASLVHGKFRGRTVVRAVFFLPVIISSGIVLQLQSNDWMKEIMQSSLAGTGGGGLGITNLELKEFLLVSGINKQFTEYLVGALDRIHVIISKSGVQMLIALAGLHSIPDSFYEAADMEGASSWENFWKITFPILSPVIIAIAVYSIIDSFTSYDNQVMKLIQETAFGQSRYGESAAMAWVYFILVLVILAVLFVSISKKIFYQE